MSLHTVVLCSAGEPDVGGYDVYMTRQPSGAAIGLCGSGSFATDTASNGSITSLRANDGTVMRKAAVGRRLKQLVVKGSDDTLDGFRKATDRGSCSHSASYGWRMAGIPETVDVARYRSMLAGHDVVDILAEAARLLKG